MWGVWVIRGRAGWGRWICGVVGSGVCWDFDGDDDPSEFAIYELLLTIEYGGSAGDGHRNDSILSLVGIIP